MKLSKSILKNSSVAELSVENDPRPHGSVTIAGHTIVGLLDSGASISCLGRDSVNVISQLNLKMKPVASVIKTADGADQKILGYVDTNVTYCNKTKLIRLYVVPSLSQSLYLGIDFWNLFGLSPVMVSELTPTTEDSTNHHSLSSVNQARLDEVISKFPSCKLEGLGKTSLIKHQIDVGSATPIKQRHYPVSPAVQAVMYAELDRMLDLGVIEESQSAWNAPVVLVRKSNGKARLCLDSRMLNKVTVKDAYPMPIIEGILGRLEDTHYISSIDLKDAFWQIELDNDSRPKTAFTVPGRPLYQYCRMPFGLCNSPQTMCRLMDKVIPGDLREYVFVFIDDLLVVSADFDSHIERLERVAQCLRQANLTINIEKSKFVMREIRYLGYIVGNGCLKTDPDKVRAIKEFPVPATVRQVRRFLGITGWYRRFIANYSGLAAPLTDLTAGRGKFCWTNEAQEAFRKLKDCITTAPVLANPDFTRKFIIQCDASGTGVGSVLYQVHADGLEHPIAFWSKKLNAAQRNYSVTELECYAAVLSVKKFRAYVEGMPFKVVTDHASLKWLMSQKDLSGRLARWSLKLQAFDFEIEHRKGVANVVPDALSRMFAEEIVVDPSVVCLFVELDSEHFDSESYSKLRENILLNKGKLPDLEVRDRHVFKRTEPRTGSIEDALCWKLWIPEPLQAQLISRAHDPPLSAHRGTAKTFGLLQRQFYWPGMSKQVREYVGSCDLCKETKAPNVILRPSMGHRIVVDKPWQRLYTDLLGPYPRSKLGNTHLLIVLDQFTKFPLLKPIRNATATIITRYLETEVFHVFGAPESILTDNGAQYVSKMFADLLKKYGVAHIRTAGYSPQANASERVNRSILASIRSYIGDDHRNWDSRISAIGSALRNTSHESSGFSPHYLVFNRHMVQHGSAYKLLREMDSLPNNDIEILPPSELQLQVQEKVRDNLRKAHQTHTTVYNRRSRFVNFRPGQEVFRRNFTQSSFAKQYNAKLAKKFVKCRIRRKVGSAIYEVEDMKGKKLPFNYHAQHLKQ